MGLINLSGNSSNYLNSLTASIQEKLVGERFQKEYLVYLIRCLWSDLVLHDGRVIPELAAVVLVISGFYHHEGSVGNVLGKI